MPIVRKAYDRFVVGYRQQEMADRYDTIVIGSGAGGLAAAVLLTTYGGQKVLVLERHYAPGGFTQSFHRPGFDWDVGLHYIGLHDETLDYRRVFSGLTGGSLEWSDLPDVYDRVIIGERGYEFWSGRERFQETLKYHFPEESGAIDRYLAAVIKCSDASRCTSPSALCRVSFRDCLAARCDGPFCGMRASPRRRCCAG